MKKITIALPVLLMIAPINSQAVIDPVTGIGAAITAKKVVELIGIYGPIAWDKCQQNEKCRNYIGDKQDQLTKLAFDLVASASIGIKDIVKLGDQASNVYTYNGATTQFTKEAEKAVEKDTNAKLGLCQNGDSSWLVVSEGQFCKLKNGSFSSPEIYLNENDIK